MPTRALIAAAAAASRRELAVAGIVFAWIALGAGTDSGAGIWRQRLVGVMTWALLVALLRGEKRSVRLQVVGVIIVATCVEYTASPFLGYYTYRLHNVPSYVPPGHGLVYLAALSIGRSQVAGLLRQAVIGFTLVVCGAWALWGLFLSPRRDAFGAVMYLVLLRFTLRGSRPLVYAGAFLVTSYLELIGTGVGAWAWAHQDPSGTLSIGNPPSGIPGGYCFLDAAGVALGPRLGALFERRPVAWPRLRPLPDEAG
ncbi:MAG TPA: hypothetical protein VHI30_14210 [Gaiellales bacterium]|nr:hypothetical protein [Gaiellales bacterium]